MTGILVRALREPTPQTRFDTAVYCAARDRGWVKIDRIVRMLKCRAVPDATPLAVRSSFLRMAAMGVARRRVRFWRVAERWEIMT